MPLRREGIPVVEFTLFAAELQPSRRDEPATLNLVTDAFDDVLNDATDDPLLDIAGILS